jgi:RNase P subunit RPR2
MLSGYCVRCRTTVPIKNPQRVRMKNGRAATKGVCPNCGTGIYRIGG